MLGGVDIVNSAERHLRHDERRLANDDGVTANPTLPAALSAEVWEKRRYGVVWTGLTGLYEHTDLFAANAAHANAVRCEQRRVLETT